MDHGNDDNPRRGFFSSPANLAVLGFLAIGGFYLIAEHRAHAFGLLPFLLLLACPLLHTFMHRDHGGHDGRNDRPDGPATGGSPPGAHRH